MSATASAGSTSWQEGSSSASRPKPRRFPRGVEPSSAQQAVGPHEEHEQQETKGNRVAIAIAHVGTCKRFSDAEEQATQHRAGNACKTTQQSRGEPFSPKGIPICGNTLWK